MEKHKFQVGDRVVVLVEVTGDSPCRTIFRHGYAGTYLDGTYGDINGRVKVLFDTPCDYGEKNDWYCNQSDLVQEIIFNSPLYKALK